MKHKILIIVIIVIHSFPTLSQVNLIYRDDSSSYLKVLPPINYGDFDIRLKDSMPDGRYLLINAWRKDSVANIDHFLIESSQYIGKLRNGPYYRFSLLTD